MDSPITTLWKSIKNILLNPSVDDRELSLRLARIRKELPAPVFWLLGKTQSGKTAIIRALTGDEQAQIGNGFQPCTRFSRIYHFPREEDCLMRFLDTRGLGEIDYDASEDIRVFSRQTQVLIVVMKAMDHAQKPVIDQLKAIRAMHPRWPVIVAQTCLHEGYQGPDARHIEAYPFSGSEHFEGVPENLQRSLRHQRQMLKDQGVEAIFVPLDFTLPEDGFDPVFYGLDAFWDALEQSLPKGLLVLLRDAKQAREQIRDLYRSTVHPHIVSYSILAGLAGAVPVPFVDMPLVAAIQLKLFQTIASVYQQSLNRERLQDIGSAIGVGSLTNLAKRELLKFIPAYGAAAASLMTAASTYALGKTLDFYFSHAMREGVKEREIYQQIFRENLKAGKELLNSYMHARGSAQED
ncbi:MAG: GTPase family protein [Methylococcales bacterium]